MFNNSSLDQGQWRRKGPYRNGIRPPDQGDLVVGLGDAGLVDGWSELCRVNDDRYLGAPDIGNHRRVQRVDGAARLEHAGECLFEFVDVAHVV